MRDTDYAYAVARIRCNETGLLDEAKLEQLITAESFSEAMKRLGDLGYDTRTNDLSAALRAEQQKAWELLCEIAPDKSELEFLTVRNSFANLKAALKSFVAGREADEFFVEPANVEPALIKRAVTEKDFSILPDYMRDTAAEAYELLTTKGDGQLSDTLIDKKSLEMFLAFSKKTQSQKLPLLVDSIVAVTDIKIALRAVLTGKGEAFLQNALARSESLDCKGLQKAALGGLDELIAFVSGTPYREAGELLKTSSVAFEKWCDDRLISAVSDAKYEPFGFLPLAAYYIAKENEIKNIRIIMAAKENDLPTDIIRERMRVLYV